MPLFDDVPRSDSEKMLERESYFQFLNRSARAENAATREKYEGWFENYPSEAQPSLRTRFRSNDSQHGGAAFELLIHEMLVRMGCTVISLDLESKKPMPDFQVAFRGKRCIIEATTADPKSDGLRRTPADWHLLSLLQSIPSSDFRISYEQRGRLSRALGKYDVVPPFERLLASYDPDEVQLNIDALGDSARPFEIISDGNWQLRGRLIPLPASERGGPPRSSWIFGPGRSATGSGSKALNKAVRVKASKYRHLETPLVVAINCQHMTFDMESGFPEAMLGKEKEPRPEQQRLARATAYRAGGVWADSGFRPRHGQLAAVLAFSNIHPRNLGASGYLFLNPFVDKEILLDCLFELPVVEVTNGDIQWSPGRPATDFLSSE